jgi:hypothetical protein
MKEYIYMMKYQVKNANVVKNSSHVSTLAHETRKNTRKLVLCCLVCLGVFLTISCKEQEQEQENGEQVYCYNVENPLTDLLWLKEIVLQHEKNNTNNTWVRIFQTTYKDGIGFHVCLHGGAFGSTFHNCAGKVLCTLGHGAFEDITCPELKIDFGNRILLWEINNPF